MLLLLLLLRVCNLYFIHTRTKYYIILSCNTFYFINHNTDSAALIVLEDFQISIAVKLTV